MIAAARTFRAACFRDALSAVKDAFGGDALILDTREVGGGLARGRAVEVVAGPGCSMPAFRPGASTADLRLPGPFGGRAATPREWLATFLVRRGLEETHASEVADTAVRSLDLPAGRPARPATLIAAAGNVLAEILVPCAAPWRGQRRRLVAVVGPTGVGKTTTVAKIAARALLDSNRRVALITVDAYRVGAVAHLTQYGEIMRIPVAVAHDQASLARAVARFSAADLILIDTTGRADAPSQAREAALVQSVGDVEVHLVLAATSGASQLAMVAERHRATAPRRLIVTKVDEAVAPGCALAAVTRLKCAISCVTDGQNVPEDVHALSTTELVRLFVGSEGATESAARRQFNVQ